MSLSETRTRQKNEEDCIIYLFLCQSIKKKRQLKYFESKLFFDIESTGAVDAKK